MSDRFQVPQLPFCKEPELFANILLHYIHSCFSLLYYVFLGFHKICFPNGYGISRVSYLQDIFFPHRFNAM